MLNLNTFKYIYILKFKSITNMKIKNINYYKKKFLFNISQKKKIKYKINFKLNENYNGLTKLKPKNKYYFKKYIKNFNLTYDVLSFIMFSNHILKFKNYFQNEFIFFYKTNKTFYKNRQIYKPHWYFNFSKITNFFYNILRELDKNYRIPKIYNYICFIKKKKLFNVDVIVKQLILKLLKQKKLNSLQ